MIKKILDKLPLKWTERELQLGVTMAPSATHMPALIYPNPLNPSRYVVLNSGFTIREYDHLNNARQVPKLPDWAVLDITVPPSSKWPAKVIGADFFDESWQVRSRRQ